MPTVRVGDNELYYVDEGDGFPVVLIHGLAGDHSAWTPQLPALAQRYRTVAFDNRGAGRSTQRDEAVSTQDLAHDTLALMDTLEVERAHVVGRSMGGAIAQHMALLAPDRIQSLALLASFARLDPVGRRVLTNMRQVLEWTGSWESHAKHSVPNFVSTRFFNEQPEAVARIEALIGGETRLQACYVRQNHACLEHDTLDRLAEIRCPTLVCGGGRDPICSPTATAWLGGVPDSETVMFEDSSHFFLIEEPERFLQLLLGWLERNTPAAA
jgi:pimeloyl-ACP methyl ester carboxylesterase